MRALSSHAETGRKLNRRERNPAKECFAGRVALPL